MTYKELLEALQNADKELLDKPVELLTECNVYEVECLTKFFLGTEDSRLCLIAMKE